MAAKLSPVLNSQIFDANGNPLIGGTIETYLAGSSTPFNTFVSSDGLTPQTNPIVLNALGQSANLIWLQSGSFYKFIVKDSLGNVQNTLDDIQGVNELIVNLDQWVTSSITPTYINATTFTLAGDQTSVYQISRRLKLSVTAGTLYGTVLSAVYGALTTVTVKLDSGALDAGLSSLSYGILTPDNSSFPSIIEDTRQTIVATATTTPLWDAVGKIQDWTGTPTITNLPNAPQAGSQRITYPAAGTIITDNANIDVQGNTNYTIVAGDEITITAITVSTFYVTIKRKDGLPVVAPDVGFIKDYAGSTAPTGYLACPISLTNISRTTYAALFAAIGTTWGAGDGSTTFAMPWFPANYAGLQANSNVGASSVGQVISHLHKLGQRTNITAGGGITIDSSSVTGAATNDTFSTGGSANLAAGMYVLKCVKY